MLSDGKLFLYKNWRDPPKHVFDLLLCTVCVITDALIPPFLILTLLHLSTRNPVPVSRLSRIRMCVFTRRGGGERLHQQLLLLVCTPSARHTNMHAHMLTHSCMSGAGGAQRT